MIKVRLHGEEGEISGFARMLGQQAGLRLLSVSAPYADRGSSVYSRLYIELEMAESDENEALGTDSENSRSSRRSKPI